MNSRSTLPLAATLLLASAGNLRGQTPAGDAFLVSTTTSGYQKDVALASQTDGRFVIVWNDDRVGGYDIYARAFDADGTAAGSDFRVHDSAGGYQGYPDIAARDSGYLVVWSEIDAVIVRALDADGAPIGADLAVNSTSANFPFDAAVSGTAAGQHLVIWSEVSTTPTAALWARLIDGAGTPQASQFEIRATTASQEAGRVAAADGGAFVVMWNESPQSNSFEVHARRVSSTGIPSGASFRVDAGSSARSLYPSISAATDGGFLVTWWNDTDDDTIRARRIDADGSPVGAIVAIGSGTGRSRAVSDGANGWTVVWSGGPGVVGDHIGADLQPSGTPFVVSPESFDTRPAVTTVGAGDFVVAWTSNPPAYTVVEYDVHARRYHGLFKDGFENGATTAWSTTVP